MVRAVIVKHQVAELLKDSVLINVFELFAGIVCSGGLKYPKFKADSWFRLVPVHKRRFCGDVERTGMASTGVY